MYENENKLENNELEEKGQEDLDSRAKSAIQFMSDVIGTSFERALKTLNSQNKMENVAIFVDYDNVYWTLMNYYSHVLTPTYN